MSRCQHCNKLTHSENMNVRYKSFDMDKIIELQSLENWTPAYQYLSDPLEIGKLKCGDITIHFIVENE